ncbi:iron-containing alcohol dehydrogenase [Burkholderia stabilis]|uniref:iron-containing alcohol dehydrogenase n=1 Tax=Burkholderia stabilis TaxID=95485 RepID=UPI0015916233|nr:iron-containing alcohol dehydrogenase [Burkholderia stabilis]
MTTFGVLRSPRQVLFGAGQRHAISKVVAEYGRRAFICSDARYAQDSELSNIGRSLIEAGVAIHVYTGTIAELPLECIEEAAKLAREFQPDVVIGIGGGSCLDIAKLVALQLAHNGPLSDYYGEFKVPGPVLPLIAIPTTSGTGSEVTPVAVLADPIKDTKVGISSPHLIPQVAICDPELTLTCPRSLTAIAGADALTHAIEAFTAKKKHITSDIALQQVFVGKNAISDVHALAAIRALAGYLKKSVENGRDLEAREQVMFGALQAGMAFGMAGTAAAHAIQYPVGAVTHTAHGMGVAALMPYVMQFNLKESIPEFAEIARVFGVDSDSDDEEVLASLAIDAVARLLQDIGIPTSLTALGLDKAKATWVAEQAMLAARLVKNNPREIDSKAMARLVDAAIAGDRAALCD